MSFLRTSRLYATAAVSAGLAFGGLTLAAPSANAAPASASANYHCTTPLPLPGLDSFNVPATFSLENLPDTVTANLPVPAGLPVVGTLDFSAAGLLPSLFLTLQSTVNTVLANVPGAGDAAVPLNAALTQIQGNVATVSGQLGSFTPGAGGALPIPLPTELDFGQLTGLLSGLGISCKLDSPATAPPIGVLNVVKQGAKMKAKAAKKVIQMGKRAVVTVKVTTSAGQQGVGAVTAKAQGQKAKTKVLKNGTVKFVFKHLTIGMKKLKFSFAGNAYTNAAKKKLTIRVAR